MEREPDMAVTGNTVEQAKHAIANVAEQATARAESGLTRAKDRTAGTLDAVAQSLRSVGNDLRGRNEETIGRFVDRAADRADQIANRLNNADPAAWIDDIEKFARREPALFIGGAIAAGLLAARFLKSSRRAEGQQPSSTQQPPRMNAAPAAERDVTDSLVHRDTPGSAGQPTF